MRKVWQDEAWEDYLYWQMQDRKTLKKINRLLSDIDRNGYQCTGKPEALSGSLAGFWSVRIDEKNRICSESWKISSKSGSAGRTTGISNIIRAAAVP